MEIQLQIYDRKKMIQQCFDTVAAVNDHHALSFFLKTAKRLAEHPQLTQAKGEKALMLKTLFTFNYSLFTAFPR